MITPLQIVTRMQELLGSGPKFWLKDSFYAHREGDEPPSEAGELLDANCFCLTGAMDRALAERGIFERIDGSAELELQIVAALYACLPQAFLSRQHRNFHPRGTIEKWNDARSVCYKDVVELIEKAKRTLESSELEKIYV